MQPLVTPPFNSLVYSLVGIEFPKRREEIVGYCQSACGIGLMSGPVIGGILYSFLKFEKTFLVFAGLLFLSGLMAFFFLPNRMNKVKEEPKEEASEVAEAQQDQPVITFSMFLTNMRAMVTIVSAAISMIFMLFFSAILSTHLGEAFGISIDKASYIMALGALFYALTSPMVRIIFDGVPRRYVTQLAFIIAAVALFYFGPSKVLGYPK